MPQHGELSVTLALIRAWDENPAYGFNVAREAAEKELGIEINAEWARVVLRAEKKRRFAEQSGNLEEREKES